MKDSPVACTLSDSELQQRRAAGLLAQVQGQVQEVKPLDSGYALRFESTNEIMNNLTTLI